MTFCSMGLGHCGALPQSNRKQEMALVGTDYFTKWVEAEPLANIRVMDAKRFVWKNIVTQCCEILKYSQVYELYRSIV